jgi:hypothetical protein
MAVEVLIEPTAEGTWRVLIPQRGVCEEFLRLRAAQMKGRRLAREHGGGEVLLHTRSHGLVERETVPAADSNSASVA